MPIKTHSRQTQTELGLTSEEWDVLYDYVKEIEGALEAETTDIGGVEEVEEDPPSIDSNWFSPGGWVGLYPGGITVVPRHISEAEYEALLNETQKWTEIIGATTIETAFPLSTDILLDARTRLGAYSKALIELSEMLQAHRLPVEIQRTRQRGFQPEGRPLFEETIRESAHGSQQVVSEETRFSFDTILNHLLVRFHIELLSEMRDLADRYPYYEAAFSTQIDYHDDFVNTGIPSRFVNKAVQTDFAAPAVIARARREATDEMAEIVDLWEAFKQDIGMELSLSNNLNTAVKPISKLYELWCLGFILECLADLTGREPINPQNINLAYQFGDDITLHYNRRLGRFSTYFKDNLGFSHGPGRPDFALEVGGELIWIGDAKFKTNIKLSDYRQILTYAVDFLGPEQVSTIFYVAEQSRGEAHVRDYPIDHLTLRPNVRGRARDELDSTFQQLLTPN